jgi:hypothetical protein
MKVNQWKLRRIFEKIDAKFIIIFNIVPQKVLLNTSTTKKTRCLLLFHLGISAPYGLFHTTLLDLVFNYKNLKKLFTKKLLVIPTSSDRIMIVLLVVELDAVIAVKKI